MSRSAEAAEYIIDTDALTITNNGVAWDFGGTGTLIASSVNNQGIAEFVIGGNLILSQNDTLRGIGNRPAALFVGNNVDIATGSTIDFSALINVAGPGGGVGGTGGDGGAGGARGAGAVGGSGGAGGFGSVGFGPIPIGLPPVVRATPGNDGLSSVIGRAGAKGQEGEHGANGFNASGAGQAGAVSTQLPIYLTAFGGTGGSEGSFPPIPSVIPGQGAIICAIGQTLCSDGHDGAGGSKGANAPSSLSGLQGGAAQNIGSGFELSGGGGGAGGSGGGGGHGGAGGSSGGGGAGGQGAWPTNTSFFPYWIGIGGEGGDGGRGGNGGIGGFGGIGGSGAQGGAGGGALAVNALGTIRIDGSAHARGGDGATGTPGTAPQDPGVGFPGTSGQFTGVPGVNFSPPPFTGILGWAIPIPKPSIGSSGGDGGQGGNGGDGGAGGAGGNGGGGAGGTLKLVGSAIVGSGNVHTGGGLAGDVVTSAGNGRFLLGANNVATGSDSLSVLGTTGAQSSQTQLGNLSANPFVASTPSVPNLVNTNTASIVGGAEAYGRTTLQADTTALDGFGLNATLLSVSPQNAVAGAIRLDEGPAAFLQDYDGYDMILVYNTLTSGLTNVQFGANLQELDPSGNPVADPTTLDLAPFHAFPLLDGGWANDPAFGGLGDVLNGSLDGYEVYATLVPEDTTNEGLNFAFSVENAGNTFVATLDKFANGDTLFAEFNPNVAVLESTWVGSTGIGGAGTWNAASHWSTVDANGNLVANVVPNNSTAQAFNVNINSGQADVAQDTLITIDRLSIGNGDALTVLDEQRLILERFSVRSASGTIENNGTITLGATGSNPLNPTAMRLSGTGLQFDGAGTLTSTDNANNQLTGIRQTDSVTNGANHTIEMVGQLGGDSLKITNQGTIRAMVSATNAELVINPSGTSTNEAARFINEGTVVADGAGRVLRVLDGRMDHREGATLTATNGGTLLIDNSTLDIAPNSTVSATGSGSVLEVTGGSVVNLNSGSQLFTDNGGQLNFRGSTMTNRGEILGSTHLQNMTIDNRGGGFESDSPITVGGDLLLQGGFFLAELQSHATEISSSIALADVTLEAGASLNSTNEFGLKGDIVSLTVLADFSTDGDMRIGGNGRPTALIGEFELGFSSLEPASPGVAETLVIDNSTIATINDLGSVGWKVNSNVTLDNQGDVTISRTSGPQLSWFGEIINRGTIRSQTSHASNIAVRYAGLTLDNEGGILIDGSFDNVVVTGGEIRSELGVETPHADFRHLTLTGPGTVDIFSGDFDSVTNNLSNAVLSGEFITLRNRFTNNGLFSFSEDVQIQGDLILDGTGIGEITDGIGGPDGATLTIGLSRLYIGGGIFQPQTIGNNELFIVNTSLITGDPPQFVFDDEEPYTIDPKGDRFSATPGVVNEGAMEHVWLEDAHVDNRQGTLAGVSLRGTRIVGGEVLSSPLADVRILTHSVLEDVTLGGTVDVQADLELRGTHLATGATTPVIDLNGGNLIVAGDVSVDGIRIDLKSQQLIGTPADRLTIESGAELMTSGATTTLNLGPTTPSIINHGAILLDNMVGTPITETVTAGTENFSEVAYVAATGGDLTGMDPTSTITVPVDVDFTSKPLIKNYGTIGNGLSFETGLIGVAIENHGTFIGRIALIDSEVINTSSAPISLTLLHDSALIGGETAPDTLPIQISGDSSFVDVTVNAQNIWLNADNASLTLTGSSQVDPNDLDLGSMVVNGDVTTDPNQIFMEVVLRGNVTVGSAASIVIDTFGSTFAVEATLPANVQSGSFAGVVNNGSISLGSFGVDVELSGRFENNGSFTAPGSTADLTIGAGTYTNNGTWSMPDRLVPLPTGATFHAAPTSTLNTLGLVLDGGILAAESDWIDASAPPITWNTGGIRLTNASGHVIGSGGFVDTHLGGTTTSMPTGKSLLVDNTLTIPLGASLTLNGGTVEAGTIDHTYGGSLVVNAGRLSAATVFGAVAISGATYSPQGTSSMSGAYSQDATSTFEMAIGGSAAGEFDSLNVAGAVSLDGSLVVILEDDFSPALGDTFTVVSSPIGISGTFDATQFPAVDPLLAWAAFYEPNAITLAIAPALTGDFNGDGSVDAADFTVWRDNFGASGPGLVADADLNGVVNNDDLNLWKTNFGNSANVLAVPEPDFAAFALFLFAVAIATFRTRSRQSG